MKRESEEGERREEIEREDASSGREHASTVSLSAGCEVHCVNVTPLRNQGARIGATRRMMSVSCGPPSLPIEGGLDRVSHDEASRGNKNSSDAS